MPSNFKGWVIAGLGIALGIAAANVIIGVAGKGLKG
jgi:hypothetical protein